jgi:hypothetical protein
VGHILNHTNPVNILTLRSFRTNFNIILPSMPTSCKLSHPLRFCYQNFARISLLSYVCYMPCNVIGKQMTNIFSVFILLLLITLKGTKSSETSVHKNTPHQPVQLYTNTIATYIPHPPVQLHTNTIATYIPHPLVQLYTNTIASYIRNTK